MASNAFKPPISLGMVASKVVMFVSFITVFMASVTLSAVSTKTGYESNKMYSFKPGSRSL